MSIGRRDTTAASCALESSDAPSLDGASLKLAMAVARGVAGGAGRGAGARGERVKSTAASQRCLGAC